MRSGIGRLRLYNFRNYAALEMELGPGLNVLVGENAQGKSNLLEAVATLALTRSPRAGSPAELLRWGSEEAAVDAELMGPAGSEKLGLRLRRQGGAVAGVPADASRGRIVRASLLADRPVPARTILGRCPVILFWPDDLQLVKAGPDARRRQLDTLLCQLDVVAADELARYRRVLEQRNALLRRLGASARDHAQLGAFDEALVRHGSRVEAARRRLVRGLAPLAAAAMTSLSGGRDELQLRYRAHAAPEDHGASDDVEEIAGRLAETLRARRADELGRGITLVGPHRDDLEYLVDGRSARSTASQGQQRTAVLAAKLAELRYARERSGRLPLLLLDDVLSELDPRRGALLLGSLDEEGELLQTLITGTDQPALGSRAARRFVVRHGMVIGM